MVLLCFIGVFTTSYSQKGMGENQGLSKSNEFPELVSIEGTVTEIKTGPCALTIGKSNSGTHLMVFSEGTLFNVHLGPTSQVKNFVAESMDQPIALIAFRTKKLPHNHYIAQKIAYRGNELVLRDGYLKPFWADKNCKAIWK